MKVAFLHYHLKTGGVTTVLLQQAEIASRNGEVMLLTGEPPPKSIPKKFQVTHIPGIGYDTTVPDDVAPEAIADAVFQAIRERWPEGCDILHVHNPLLAKNGYFLDILAGLKKRGVELFLQIHDFAEDGRPDVYFSDPYPKNCHYGAINSRDYGLLLKSGLKPDGLHLLPNTVPPPSIPQDDELQEDYILYPVRAIRRKNIGESLLLSRYFPHGEALWVTLPPNSLMDIAVYTHWMRFADTADMSVRFEVGLSHDFGTLVSGARSLLSTSISEGFGFAFLSPWTWGKTLWGRILPDICRDFEYNQLRLDHLYSRLAVPIQILDLTNYKKRWISAYHAATDRFGMQSFVIAPEPAFEKLIRKETIDFGLLDESAQRQVLEAVLSNATVKQSVRILNHHLEFGETDLSIDDRIRRNSEAVRKHYGRRNYEKLLMAAYRKIMNQDVIHRIDKKVLTKAFLNPQTFTLLKWAPYIDNEMA